jgi:hypothetical protein
MKTVVAVVWQTIVLVLAAFGGFIAGMVVPAIRIQRVLSPTRTYDYNWIVAVVIVYALLLLIGLLRKRMRETLISASIALVITLAGLALFTQIGIKDIGV